MLSSGEDGLLLMTPCFQGPPIHLVISSPNQDTFLVFAGNFPSFLPALLWEFPGHCMWCLLGSHSGVQVVPSPAKMPQGMRKLDGSFSPSDLSPLPLPCTGYWFLFGQANGNFPAQKSEIACSSLHSLEAAELAFGFRFSSYSPMHVALMCTNYSTCWLVSGMGGSYGCLSFYHGF